MRILKILTFLLSVLCISKSTNDFNITQCQNDYRDQNNVTIDVHKYCSNKMCIQKCCPVDSFIGLRYTCVKISQIKSPEIKALLDTHNITFYTNTEPRQKIEQNFEYILNNKNLIPRCGEFTPPSEFDYYFTENAEVKIYDASTSKQWYTLSTWEYCVDSRYDRVNKRFTFVVKEYLQSVENDGLKLKETLLFIGLVISSVFLLLVFIVHCMLKTLNSSFTGMLMMAYTITILLAFIVKVTIQATIGFMNNNSCKIITPFLYFLLMSSFFWLNAFSFCIWRGVRTNFKLCTISQREKLISFGRYGLYAWGAPLVITGIVTYLDNIDIRKLDFLVKPPFVDCFTNKYGIQQYYFIPLGIIMLINIILFIMSIYHLRTQKVKNTTEFRRSGTENSYKTYMKLSLTMGVSWVLELIPNSENIFLFILSNTYNSLIGVVIFFVYICDKNVLKELCKKYNIRNDFVNKLAHRKSLFRLVRSMKKNKSKREVQAHCEELADLKSGQRLTENKTPLNNDV